MDFTIKQYTQLLKALQSQGYFLKPFAEFIEHPGKKVLVLRHDVDALPKNSLRFAKLQAAQGIAGTYYFRIIPQSFNERIIKEISAMGHEVGYHYETMDTYKGSVDKAYDEFCGNLNKFRKLVPIKTISMHGSPLSKFDNREIWKKYDYKKLGIIGEPYFDIDFSEIAYYTDTGRRWDGEKVSVRDKPMRGGKIREYGVGCGEEQDKRQKSKDKSGGLSDREMKRQQIQSSDSRFTTNDSRFPVYRTTNEMIKAIEAGTFPKKSMLTFHPQRWHDNWWPWGKELVWQNVKNQGKMGLISLRNR